MFLKKLSENFLYILSECKRDGFLADLEKKLLKVRKHHGFRMTIVLDGGLDGFHENEDKDRLVVEWASALLFLYMTEYSFRRNIDYSFELLSFFDFVLKNKSSFSPRLTYIFDFSSAIPFYIMRDEFHSEHAIKIARTMNVTDMDKVDKFIQNGDGIVEQINEWKSSYQEKIDAVQELEKKLDEQKTAFNFVGLYKGFEGLKGEKMKDLDKANREYYWLGAGMLATPICELLWILFHFESIKVGSGALAILGLSTVSLVVMLFYFLRVCLAEVKSLKSQIMQLELRMTLCQFIQNYADTSKELKEKNKEGFEKFESLIFSSIVSSDEKIPSTFDGMDQLTNLLKVFQK